MEKCFQTKNSPENISRDLNINFNFFPLIKMLNEQGFLFNYAEEDKEEIIGK